MGVMVVMAEPSANEVRMKEEATEHRAAAGIRDQAAISTERLNLDAMGVD